MVKSIFSCFFPVLGWNATFWQKQLSTNDQIINIKYANKTLLHFRLFFQLSGKEKIQWNNLKLKGMIKSPKIISNPFLSSRKNTLKKNSGPILKVVWRQCGPLLEHLTPQGAGLPGAACFGRQPHSQLSVGLAFVSLCPSHWVPWKQMELIPNRPAALGCDAFRHEILISSKC